MALMMHMYPGMIEAALEAKLYARRLISKRGNNIFQKSERIEHSNLFKLRKEKLTGEIFCCRLS